jgi:HK97 family phage major capsid protein
MYNDQFSTMNKAIREIGLAAKASAEAPEKGATPQKAEFEAVKEKLNAIAKGQHGEIEMKALTNVAAIATNTAGFDIPNVGQLATAERNAYSIFPKQMISDGQNLRKTINYWDWDESTTVRAADMVAEGGTFPESTAKWKQYNLPIQKIGDTLPITEEFLEDEQMFYAELGMFLRTNVEIVMNTQIVTGDGTGNNLTGLIASTPAYVPVASGITDASIYDLIVKLREDISTTGGNKYRSNFALMNIADINTMKLKKDANNNYILPPFVDRSGNQVDGVTVVEDNTVAANTMYLGDSRFARIYERTGLDISTGVVNAQFVEDAMTLKVRKRMAFLIRTVDQTGFRQVTSISAALTTLAT